MLAAFRDFRLDRAPVWLMLLALIASAATSPPARADDEAALWSALREGRAFAMIRHALAPGFGDPEAFRLGDCTTQRNLSQKGREQARSIGALFRQNAIGSADVYTSQWCRCRETARLLDLGAVRELPPLNSFFQEPALRQPQTEELATWLDNRQATLPLLLVTHQVNISALTGRGVASGEIVVVAREPGMAVTVLGTIKTL